jgi:hypothetical protein
MRKPKNLYHADEFECMPNLTHNQLNAVMSSLIGQNPTAMLSKLFVSHDSEDPMLWMGRHLFSD